MGVLIGRGADGGGRDERAPERETAPSITPMEGAAALSRVLLGLLFHARKPPTDEIEGVAKEEEAGETHGTQHTALGIHVKRHPHRRPRPARSTPPAS